MSKEELELRLDEVNNVTFTVSVEAPEPMSPAYRFICESEGMSYMFPGVANGEGEVQVTMPPMKGVLGEGKYDARLEVIIGDKYFAPVELQASFVQPVRVQVEGVKATTSAAPLREEKVAEEEPAKPSVSVKASGSPRVRTESANPKPKKSAPKKKRRSARRNTLAEEWIRKRKGDDLAEVTEGDVAALRRAIRKGRSGP